METGGDGGDRIDDRGGVHEELDAELHQEAQVAVFCSEGRDDDAKSEPEAGHHEDEYWRDQDPPVWVQASACKGEESHEGQEEGELDGKGDQVGEQDRDRDSQAWEVDLAEELGVVDEGVGGLGETVREVSPDDGAGHVEEELRQSVRGELGDIAEDDGEGDSGEEGLDEIPEWSEDGLFVDGDEVASYK